MWRIFLVYCTISFYVGLVRSYGPYILQFPLCGVSTFVQPLCSTLISFYVEIFFSIFYNFLLCGFSTFVRPLYSSISFYAGLVRSYGPYVLHFYAEIFFSTFVWPPYSAISFYAGLVNSYGPYNMFYNFLLCRDFFYSMFVFLALLFCNFLLCGVSMFVRKFVHLCGVGTFSKLHISIESNLK